ncbi:hypothetical protein [Rhodococcus sp. KRD175]|jgi:hypothetical protein|uniref:hypothetical protein n=1 Tax=Rhodococcus sp. KRD175 TaxID=2729729 RepID=UPI0019D2A5C0|nr:hypothetical protein [Rhodococcus sp. KRD175]
MMRTRSTIAKIAIVAAAAAGMTAAGVGTASAHDSTGFLCTGNVAVANMYGDGPGQGPVDWQLHQNEQFRGHSTINVGGTFWSYGHSTSSYPYDYWVQTGQLNCS